MVLVQRVYYEVISDAIEGCFSFGGLDTDSYSFGIELPKDVNYADVLVKAIKIEEKIQKYYSDSAEMSKSLMADISRGFERIAEKRVKRIIQLNHLIFIVKEGDYYFKKRSISN